MKNKMDLDVLGMDLQANALYHKWQRKGMIDKWVYNLFSSSIPAEWASNSDSCHFLR